MKGLKNRGLEDILIACVDGLKGFPEAIQTVYPQTHIQLCIGHMVRNSMKFVPWRDYKEVASDFKRFYKLVAVLVNELIDPWLNSTPFDDDHCAPNVLVTSLTHRLSSG